MESLWRTFLYFSFSPWPNLHTSVDIALGVYYRTNYYGHIDSEDSPKWDFKGSQYAVARTDFHLVQII